MTCEEELNALRQAERELEQFKERHLPAAGADGVTPVPTPPGDTSGSGPADEETVQRVAELTSAVKEKQDAYDKCRGRTGDGPGVEALMRDDTGKPLGGGAGPPM